MKMNQTFWERIPAWVLNAGWIGQGLTLAANKMLHFIEDDGYAVALFVGALIGVWGLWQKNRLQIRREEVELQRAQKSFEQDTLHSDEIHQIRMERERRERTKD